MNASRYTLLNRFILPQQQRLRNREAESLGHLGL